jgi:hypothetical protein
VEVVPDVRVVEQPNLGLVGFAHIAFVASLVDKVDQQLLAVASHLLFEVRLEGGTLESTRARKKCENGKPQQYGPTVQKREGVGLALAYRVQRVLYRGLGLETLALLMPNHRDGAAGLHERRLNLAVDNDLLGLNKIGDPALRVGASRLISGTC